MAGRAGCPFLFIVLACLRFCYSLLFVLPPIAAVWSGVYPRDVFFSPNCLILLVRDMLNIMWHAQWQAPPLF